MFEKNAARRAHSSNPCRMPSATAAARSETPSFSYRRCVWVFTVLAPRYSSAARSGWTCHARIPPVLVVPARSTPAQTASPAAGSGWPTLRQLGRHHRLALSHPHHGVDDLGSPRFLRHYPCAPSSSAGRPPRYQSTPTRSTRGLAGRPERWHVPHQVRQGRASGSPARPHSAPARESARALLFRCRPHRRHRDSRSGAGLETTRHGRMGDHQRPRPEPAVRTACCARCRFIRPGGRPHTAPSADCTAPAHDHLASPWRASLFWGRPLWVDPSAIGITRQIRSIKPA